MHNVVSIEGIHGAGKTTQALLLRDELNRRSISSRYFSSSDKPFSASLMRNIEKLGPQSPETLFFLSLANNAALGAYLNGHQLSILDRYVHTDIASTYAAGKDLDWIRECIPQSMYPRLVFLIDLDPQEALQRKGGNTSDLERGGLQKDNPLRDFVSYQGSLRKAYLDISRGDERICLIDGRKTREDIHAEIWGLVEERFGADLCQK